MKKSALIAVILSSCLTVFAQGTINFVNMVTGSLIAKVYGPDPSDPAGPNAPLHGTGYTVALWAGPDADHLQQWATSTFRTGTAAGYWTAIGNAVVGNVGPGLDAVVEIRAWDNHGGTITTWEDAQQHPVPGEPYWYYLPSGHSDQFTVPVLGGLDPVSGNFYLTPNLVGLTSFTIMIPEPSIVALGMLGGIGLLLIRRRK